MLEHIRGGPHAFDEYELPGREASFEVIRCAKNELRRRRSVLRWRPIDGAPALSEVTPSPEAILVALAAEHEIEDLAGGAR